jgi:hypothetical protein
VSYDYIEAAVKVTALDQIPGVLHDGDSHYEAADDDN